MATVWVPQLREHYKIGKAQKFGEIRAVFGDAVNPYVPDKLLVDAKNMLKAFQKGDFLMLAGHPVACIVCVLVLREMGLPSIRMLIYGARDETYTERTLDFSFIAGLVPAIEKKGDS